MQILETSRLPVGSLLRERSQDVIDYVDCFSVLIPKQEESIDQMTTSVFTAIPGWGDKLMALRNMLVKPFGLDTGDKAEVQPVSDDVRYEVGEKAVLFPVIERNETEIVMGSEDKHLNFECSVFAQDKNTEQQLVSLTTIVRFHNGFGKLYFNLIKPFHKQLIKQCLKQYARRAGVN